MVMGEYVIAYTPIRYLALLVYVYAFLHRRTMYFGTKKNPTVRWGMYYGRSFFSSFLRCIQESFLPFAPWVGIS